MKPTPNDFTRPPGLLKRLRHRLEFASLWAGRAVIGHCPLSVVRALADIFGTLASHADRRGRATALENLAVIFGDRYPPAERNRLVSSCYRHFARTFFELFRISHFTPEVAAHWFHTKFENEADTIAAANEGAIFITPHYGNFEWMAIAWCQLGHPLTFIAQDSKNPLVTPLIVGDRMRCGNTVVPREGALLKLLRCIKSGKQVGLLPDLTTPPTNSAVVISMFGRKTSVTSLPAALALRTGCAIIPAICIPHDNGTHTGYFMKPLRFTPGTPVADAAQACWDVFEPQIRAQPAPWLWMYKRWRYLPRTANPAEYPAYANNSKAFDKIDRDTQV